MPQTKQQIQALLQEAGSEPRHRFGQNFMIDQNLVRCVADAGEPAAGDLIVEVGPGTGTLTEELLARGTSVLAVEIDRDLAALLRRRFASQDHFRLIEGDALAGKHHLNPELLDAVAAGTQVKLIANLPYNIASPLVIELLLAGVGVLAFTVQKEVAQRLRAVPGSDAYGALSVMAQLLSRVEILRTLPAQAFWPAPTIESALVRMDRQDQFGPNAREFSTFLHALFSARRKTLRKALEQAGYDAAALAALNHSPTVRAEELFPSQLLELYRAVRDGPR